MIQSYLAARGHETGSAEFSRSQATYGLNTVKLPTPQFMDLFVEHMLAPFFVFQVLCVGLWLMDEYWYYALFTLSMLVIFEFTVSCNF